MDSSTTSSEMKGILCLGEAKSIQPQVNQCAQQLQTWLKLLPSADKSLMNIRFLTSMRSS